MHRTLSVDSKQEFRLQIGDFINGIDPERTFVGNSSIDAVVCGHSSGRASFAGHLGDQIERRVRAPGTLGGPRERSA